MVLDDDASKEIAAHLKTLPLQELFGVVAADREKFRYLAQTDKIDVLINAAKRAQKIGARAASIVVENEVANLQVQIRELESYTGGFIAFFRDRNKVITAAAVCTFLFIIGHAVGRSSGFNDGLAFFEDQEKVRSKFDPAFAAISFHYLGTKDHSPAPCYITARVNDPRIERACVVVLQSKD
jgi:hypothetical protein